MEIIEMYMKKYIFFLKSTFVFVEKRDEMMGIKARGCLK